MYCAIAERRAPYVRHGSLRVPRVADHAYREAKAYLTNGSNAGCSRGSNTAPGERTG